jgi:hypothetical protein
MFHTPSVYCRDVGKAQPQASYVIGMGGLFVPPQPGKSARRRGGEPSLRSDGKNVMHGVGREGGNAFRARAKTRGKGWRGHSGTGRRFVLSFEIANHTAALLLPAGCWLAVRTHRLSQGQGKQSTTPTISLVTTNSFRLDLARLSSTSFSLSPPTVHSLALSRRKAEVQT